MTDLIAPSRLGFLTGLGAALITAPAIVRAGSLMPVKAFDPETLEMVDYPDTYWASPADITAVVRRAFLPRIYVQMWQGHDLSRAIQIAAGG